MFTNLFQVIKVNLQCIKLHESLSLEELQPSSTSHCSLFIFQLAGLIVACMFFLVFQIKLFG